MAKPKQPPRPGKPCIFCGETRPISEEHLFGNWLRKRIPRPPTAKQEAVDIIVVGTERFLNPTPRNGLAVTIKIKGPGKKCNNGWMSNIDEKASVILWELMNGTPKILTPVEQNAIATWVTLKILVVDAQRGEDH